MMNGPPTKPWRRRTFCAGISALTVAGCVDAGPDPEPPPVARGVVQSPMLFDIARGLNEFALMFDGGRYHLYFHPFEDLDGLRLRIADAIQGLASAVDRVLPVRGIYPSVLADGSAFHLHVWDGGRVVHHVAPQPVGPWRRAGKWPPGFTDPCVVRSPLDGRYYAGCKRITGRVPTFAMLGADSVDGPWTDLGDVLGELRPQAWYDREQADGSLWFHRQRLFGAFAGFDGANQVIGVVEIDPATARAHTPATIVVRAEQPWQRAGGLCKVFNPQFVPANPTDRANRLYFAHNGGHLGRFRARRSGWAFIEGFEPT